MGCFVLTNNPLVRQRVAPGIRVEHVDTGIEGILEEAARFIADGHRLLSHPLSGSVKPGETPYKSMLLTSGAAPQMDAVSARLISSALEACGKFADKTDLYSEQTLRDLQTVDLSLICGALESARVQGDGR